MSGLWARAEFVGGQLLSRVRNLPVRGCHCHLQDPRIAAAAPSLVCAATASGVARFAVNGTSEKDWHSVKQMAEEHPAVVPCFGLHPWWVLERSPDWMDSLRRFFAETPQAAVGEVSFIRQLSYTCSARLFASNRTVVIICRAANCKLRLP